MGKYSNFTKRSLSMVLSLLMVFSVMNVGMWLGVSAGDQSVSVTEGKIVANNYELTEAEKNLIGSGYLTGNTLTFTVPDADDDLIEVTIDDKGIKAESYTNNGFTWNPVSADIVVNEETKETVVLTNGEGTYTYTGDAFSVDVKYEMYVDVAEDTQNALFAAPAVLKNLTENMDILGSANFSLVIAAIKEPDFAKLLDGYTISVMGGTATVGFKDAAKEAILDWQAQLAANGDDQTDLIKFVEEYKAATSGVAYVSKNAAAIKAEIETVKTQVEAVIGDDVFKDVETYKAIADLGILSGEDKVNLEKFITVLELLSASMNAWLKVVNPSDQMSASEYNGEKDIYKDAWTTTEVKNGDVALDVLVALIGETTEAPAVKNPLLVNTTTIRYNMSMYDVTVKVVLEKVTNNNVVVFDTKTTSVTLAENATADDIKAAVAATGVESGALTAWAEDYEADHYVRSESDLPAALVADTDYVITYSPKEYNVTYKYDAVVAYPYGYVLTLPKSDTEGVVYDYTVDGIYAPEGSTVVINADKVIDRTTGKPYVDGDLYTIVSNNYFADSDKSAAILTSGAIKGNEAVNVRYPDNNGGIVKLEGNKLTAVSYPASYNSLVWVADTYTVVSGSNRTTYEFGGATVVTITEADYDRVEVVYSLTLTNYDGEVLDVMNIPDVLADEASAQIATLDRLASYRTVLGQLDKTKLGALNGVIGVTDLHTDPVKNEELRAYFTGVVGDIINNSVDTNNFLKIYNYIDAYSDPVSGGLGYYYGNSAMLIAEVNALSEYLTAMLADEEKVDALTVLTSAAGYPEYAEKIVDLESKMADIKASLTAPNALIDLDSENLGKLVNALSGAGTTTNYTTVPHSLTLTSEAFIFNADSKVTVKVTVQIGSGSVQSVYTKSFVKTAIIDAGDIAEMIAAVNAAAADTYFYQINVDPATLNAYVGVEANDLADEELAFVWTAKEFTVKVEGAEDQKITVTDREITLPACGTAQHRYEYNIGGTIVTVRNNAVKYTFTEAQMKNLFVNGELSISRVDIDESREKLINLVNDLNAGSDGSIEFALIESGDVRSIVMKLNVSETTALMGSIQTTAMTLINGGYGYYGIGGNDFVYIDANNTMKISLQAVVDALMNSGFGSETIVEIMDENGNINNISLEGTVISNAAVGNYGGKLIESTMELGNDKNDAVVLPLYITLGEANSALLQLRSMVTGEAGNYMSFAFENGAMNVDFKLPQKVYEAYLAILLVTKNVDLDNINEINAEIAISFIKDLVEPALSGEISLETFSNTLKKFGYNFDFSEYEALYAEFCNFYSDCVFNYNDITGIVDGNIQIAKIIDKLNLGDLGKMIAEYDSGIDFTANLKLNNLADDYEALYIDAKGVGFQNKAGLTKDVKAKLDEMVGGGVIVLLSDIEGDLNLDTTTILNLNGYTVNGNVNCGGKVIIVDTAPGSAVNGTVTGSVTGNAYIVGGKYASDVTAFIKDSYIQDADGIVCNKYFNLFKEDNGDINVEISADLLVPDVLPDLKAVLIDVATELIFNEYTTNMLYVDGNMIYDITIDDLVNLVAGSNRIDAAIGELVEMFDSEQLAALINTILADLTDFAAIESAIRNDKPILTYPMTSGSWAVELEHMVDGDYMSANLVSGNVTDRNFNMTVVGDDANKQAAADIFGELDATTSVDIKVEMTDGFAANDNKNFVLNWSASEEAVIDFSDPTHTLLVAIVVADGIGAPANEALVKGIKVYYETENFVTLKAAIDKLTIHQIVVAIENIAKNDTISGMIENLGLTGFDTSDIVAFEKIYDPVLKIFANVMRKLDIDSGSRTLGSFDTDGDNSYVADKADVKRSFTRDLFKGYSVTLNAEVTEASVTLKLFGDKVTPIDYTELEKQIAIAESMNEAEYTAASWKVMADALDAAKDLLGNADTQAEVDEAAKALADAIAGLVKKPAFVDETGTPAFTDNDKIAHIWVDTDNMLIFVDAHTDGITADELNSVITLYTKDSTDTIDVTIEANNAKSLVCNGAKLTAVASNVNAVETDTVEYTVIVVGDVNGNGRIESGDASLIYGQFVGTVALNNVELYAADVNKNNRIESGDAALIAKKYTDWDTYVDEYNK